MNGRDAAAIFLPLDFKTGGQNKDSCSTVGQYLTRDQARYIYKKVELGGINKHRYNTTRNRSRKTTE